MKLEEEMKELIAAGTYITELLGSAAEAGFVSLKLLSCHSAEQWLDGHYHDQKQTSSSSS